MLIDVEALWVQVHLPHLKVKVVAATDLLILMVTISLNYVK